MTISNNNELICKACGQIGKSKRAAKGSLGIEILLWCCFLVPGIIYSIFRQASIHKACRSCGSADLIPLDSPMGKELAAKMQPASAPTVIS